MVVQDWPWWSICLLTDVRYTPIDAGIPGCMRLEMRLPTGHTPLRRADHGLLTSSRRQLTPSADDQFMITELAGRLARVIWPATAERSPPESAALYALSTLD
jgi:hypothetical protein